MPYAQIRVKSWLQPFLYGRHPSRAHRIHPKGIPMRHLILASLLLVPAVAVAAEGDHCKFRAERNLDLDLSGVRSVRFAVNAYDLHLSGDAPAGKGTVRGVACASDQETVDNLLVTQERDGDTLG